MRTIRIGLLGCGTVGRGFVELLARERARIRSRYGLDLELARILVRDPAKERPGVDRALLTTCAPEVIDDGCDVVVELIGGTHSAGAYVRRAIDRGRSVVTANKALLAGAPELFRLARERGVALGFEASVCGGVPVVRALGRGLAGDSIESLTAILNGTCNYVLTRMEDGLALGEAVRLAQERGFAEADPSLDVDGVDAMQKLRILAGLAFGEEPRRATTVGIRGISQADVAAARAEGKVIRHVAEARRVAGGVELRVEPRRVPRETILGRTRDEENAVIVRGRAVGEVALVGKGAGSMPTAAAVLSDVLEISTCDLT